MASDTLDLGRVRLVHRGAYSASTVYEFFDCVTYNGSSYLCTAAAGSPAGTLPTVTATWALLAQKGDTGAKGTRQRPPSARPIRRNRRRSPSSP